MRGGLGIGFEQAKVGREITTRSESTSGVGEVNASYEGFGAVGDALGAVRIRRALVGLALVGGHSDLVPRPSEDAQALSVEPQAGLDWALIGPSGGAQIAAGPVFVVGGMFGFGNVQTRGFVGPPDVSVTSSQLVDSVMGVSGWAGPAWPLGRGWMLGAHLRVTALIEPALTEAALLLDLSFQSP